MTQAAALRVGLVQLNVGDDPQANLSATVPLIRQAASAGATLVLTPEATNILSPDRKRQQAVLREQADDPTLSALQSEARRAGIWLLIGSLALKSGDDDRFVNRSFLIDPDGGIAARYDKLHMFDVTISETEQYRESAAYRPGDRAVLAEAAGVPVGMTICYDLRFPHLYRALAQQGARILTVPSAFSPTTGEAHWQVLLRARAIETGCFVLAPAQTGRHEALHGGGGRRSFGHSLAVSPWGEVLLDAGTEPGVHLVEIDPDAAQEARAKVPSLSHDREVSGP